MKKIIMCCCVFALLLCLSVPCFAAEDDFSELLGTWVFNDTLSKFNLRYTPSIDFSSNGRSFTAIDSTGGGSTFRYISGTDYYTVYSSGWTDNNFRTIEITNIRSVASIEDGLFLAWLNTNAVKMSYECDGSSCPATDVNHDDICDDCGLPFTYNLRDDTTYLYNDIRLPIVPSPFGDKATYYTLYDDGTGTYTLVASDVRFWEDMGRIVVTEKGSLIYYAAASGDDEWSQFSTQTSGNWVHEVKTSETVVWSSHTIHDFTTGATFMQGDVNFLPPLMEMAGQALSGEMVKIGKTLMILVACGVGCLACLVVLSLFGKRSLIFRS